MKNPVAKNLKINRPAKHQDKKREAKKEGYEEYDTHERTMELAKARNKEISEALEKHEPIIGCPCPNCSRMFN